MAQRGGRRPGAGRKKGVSTLTKELARERIRVLVFANIDRLVNAQMSNAQGLSYLVVRDKENGKFIRVSEAMARLAQNEERVEVWEKDPSVQAFTDLLNRAVDRPKEQEAEVKVTGTLKVIWDDGD